MANEVQKRRRELEVDCGMALACQAERCVLPSKERASCGGRHEVDGEAEVNRPNSTVHAVVIHQTLALALENFHWNRP